MKSEIAYILDRSGSMAKIWDDAFNGLNAFIEQQQKLDGECVFTLSIFDDQHEVLVDAENIQTVEPISSKQAHPRGMTAFYDAIGKTVNSIGARLSHTKKEDLPDKVIVVIMSDGFENASKEFNKTNIRDMIKHQEDKYNWEFIFVGAGVDADTEGAFLQMKAINTMNVAKSKRGLDDATAYLQSTVGSYRK